MPNYDFFCKTCGKTIERMVSIKESESVKCGKCGEMMIKLFSAPRLDLFKPMVYEDICETPILIESKKQLREECKKHGVRAARLM